MKKTILFAVMMMEMCCVKAQLKVDSLGNVQMVDLLNVGSTGMTMSNCPTSQWNMRVTKSSSTTGRSWNIYAQSKSQLNQNYNIYALIEDSLEVDSEKKYYGVFSSVSHTRSPYSYGILGRIGWKGIGVYGTTGYTLPIITQAYAGYFSGPTHVQGNLTVSGNISGILLNNSAYPSPSISTTNEMTTSDKIRLSNRLQNLTAQTFYINAPQPTIRSEASVTEDLSILSPSQDGEDVSKDDMVVGMPEPTAMEKQIYAKQHYGLNADQLEEVFPDLVYENEDGSKSINYVEMVPILVQAINELSAKVEVLEGSSTAKKAATRATGVEETGDNLVMLSLGQNKPNPFGATTSIDISIPESVQKAFIYVYDLQGKKVDQVDITSRGKQTVQLNAAILSDGMYLYSLIADGRVVETRRMIVEK